MAKTTNHNMNIWNSGTDHPMRSEFTSNFNIIDAALGKYADLPTTEKASFVAVITEIYNALKAVTDGSSGANYIGATPVLTGGGNNVQSNMEAMYAAIIETVLGQIPNDTITNDKMAQAMKKGIAGGVADYDTVANHTAQFADLTNYNKIDLTKYKLAGADMVDTILEKLQQGYRYFIIPKNTRFNKTLELLDYSTGVNREQIIFEGSEGNSDIELNTGGIGILINGSDNIVFRNLGLVSYGMPNPSTIAIVQQRSDTRDACQLCYFDRVKINMANLPDSNGGRGSIGIYNNCAELSTYMNINVDADLPLVLTRSDIYSLGNRRSLSMECVSFTGVTSLLARKGNAIVLDGVSDVTFENLYMAKDPWLGVNNTQFAILLTGNVETGRYNYNVNFNCFECESFTSLMDISGKVEGLLLKGTHNHAVDVVVQSSENGEVLNSKIDIYVVTATAPYAIVKVSNLSQVMANTDIYMYEMVYASIQCDAPLYSCRTYSTEKPTINKTHVGVQTITSFYEDGVIVNGHIVLSSWGVKPLANAGLPGAFCFNTNPVDGGNIGWYHNGADFIPFGQNGYRTVAGTPQGNLTPLMVGEEVMDGGTGNFYKAYGLANTNWKQMTT